MESQKTLVLRHLQEHGSITSMDALLRLGCFRLAAVIFRLRESGHTIYTQFEESLNSRNGRTRRYARYFLETKR